MLLRAVGALLRNQRYKNKD